jgi:hypothetical protein
MLRSPYFAGGKKIGHEHGFLAVALPGASQSPATTGPTIMDERVGPFNVLLVVQSGGRNVPTGIRMTAGLSYGVGARRDGKCRAAVSLSPTSKTHGRRTYSWKYYLREGRNLREALDSMGWPAENSADVGHG